ncbi:toxin-antitoxin system YwqK family antitoxin [uncultured Maribacter sp.]|uniref:toxin-antitoxin system YwqK family antitoxin n=1 Tax=uncultured Maribacter sp. TaxID=431308 RepID=UPI0026125A53|nr:toxin-antitoxin system YwqK family antitoxin [uncultured Maribacter sp.]
MEKFLLSALRLAETLPTIKPMKLKQAFKPLLLLSLVILFSSCQERAKTVSSFSLNKADGIYKQKEKPFTGMVLDTTKSGRVLLTFKCVEGKLDGEYLEYHRENGNLKQRTTYQNGKKTGPYIELTKDGDTIISGNYLDYKKNGEWKEHYSNGNIKRKGTYSKGLQTGEWKYFFYNGKIQAEGTYQNGNESNHGTTGIPLSGRTGLWKFYSKETGKLEQESEFENGKISGQLIGYKANGQIDAKINYKNDELHGVLEFFDESGKLMTKQTYENGKLIKEHQIN